MNNDELFAPANIKFLEQDVKRLRQLIIKEQSITPCNTLYISQLEDQISVNELSINLFKKEFNL